MAKASVKSVPRASKKFVKPKARSGSKYEAKTKPTKVSAAGFIAAVDGAQRRADSEVLVKMMRRVTGKPPVMWGPSIVGFGSKHFRYDSGHEGDIPLVGFSPRASALTLYVRFDAPEQEALLSKLGTFKTSKSCLYIKKLADVDEKVLEQLVRRSVELSQQQDA